MKAATFPGAKRTARRVLRRRGRRRGVIVTLAIGAWSATFSVAGVRIVCVPVAAVQKRRTS